MAKLPYMKWYPSDFIVDTQTLSLREEGAWLRLINYIWITAKNGTVKMTDEQVMVLFQDEVDNVSMRTEEGLTEPSLTHALRLLKSLIHAKVFRHRIETRNDKKVHIITSKRIARDKKILRKNAKDQSKHRESERDASKDLSKPTSKSFRKSKVSPKKSEVRSQITTTTVFGPEKRADVVEPASPPPTTTGTTNDVSKNDLPEKQRQESDVQKVVRGWKILTGIPEEGPESAAWDKVHFARHAKSAKSLLELFGSWDQAVEATEYVYMHLTAKKLSCTIETIVKHSDTYRDYKAGRKVL